MAEAALATCPSDPSRLRGEVENAAAELLDAYLARADTAARLTQLSGTGRRAAFAQRPGGNRPVALQSEVRRGHLGGRLDGLNEEAERACCVVVGGRAVAGGTKRVDTGDRGMASGCHLRARLLQRLDDVADVVEALAVFSEAVGVDAGAPSAAR
jgi:hypothetical protein